MTTTVLPSLSPKGTLNRILCPVCKTLLLSEDYEGSCPHLAYVYTENTDKSGEFSSGANHVIPRLESVEESLTDNQFEDPTSAIRRELEETRFRHFSLKSQLSWDLPASVCTLVGVDVLAP